MTRRQLNSGVALVGLGLAILGVAAEPAAPPGPLTPEQSQAQFVAADGLTVELVACEPDVVSPVALEFGPDGRLWVVEFRDYPGEASPGGVPPAKGLSRIKVLTDPERDGRYGNAVTFADELPYATGLMLWQDGLLVTVAGELRFLRDTDADGVADDSQVWWRGFAVDNPQLRANDPTLGPDGKIYIANGLRGGDLRPGAGNPWGLAVDAKPISISGRDFRFDPFTGQAEAVLGVSQFGMAFDDEGRRYTCSNRNPCKQVVFDNADLDGRPWLAIEQVEHDVVPAGPDSKLYPLTDAYTTSAQHSHQFTAACGLMIADACAYTCEPTGGLVHAADLLEDGKPLSTGAGSEGREYLASRDPWFRPVNLANGPDGGRYVCDMYRAVIEHPQWMPVDAPDRQHTALGTDRGRVWRVRNAQDVGFAGRVDRFPFKSEDVDDLIAALLHPHDWQRQTALRLLYQRRDPDAGEAIRARLERDSLLQDLSPVHHLVKTLLHPKEVVFSRPLDAVIHQVAIRGDFTTFLMDGDSRQCFVRRFKNDLNAAERTGWIWEGLTGLALRRHDWASLSTFTMGTDVRTEDLRQEILNLALHRTNDDRIWHRRLFLIHGGEDLRPFAIAFLLRVRELPPDDPRRGEILDDLAFYAEHVARRANAESTRALVTSAFETYGPDRPPQDVGRAVLRGYLKIRSGPLAAPGAIAKLLTADEQSAYMTTIARLTDELATDAGTPAERIARLELLPLLDAEQATPFLTRALTDADPAIVAAGLDVLRRFPPTAATPLLVRRLTLAAPDLRARILTILAQSREGIAALLDEVEAGREHPLEVGPDLRTTLLRKASPEVTARVKKLLPERTAGDRAAVVTTYEPCLTMPADPARGREVFKTACATCHRVGELGQAVGPDISDTYNKTPAYLLTNILDPNRAIDSNYFSVAVSDTSGRVVTGLIQQETGATLTIRQADGQPVTLSRAEIEEVKNLGVSLMPEGFERTIPPAAMADLIAYLRHWRRLPTAD